MADGWFQGLPVPIEGIVIGDGQRAQAGYGSFLNQVSWRVSPVGVIRVRVEVNQIDKMNLMRLTALIFFALLLSGCQQKTMDDFAAFEEDYFNALFADQPTFATLSGIHLHDDVLEDLTQGRVEARTEALRQQAARLAAIREQPLTSDQSIDAEALQARIGAELFELTEERSWETNPMLYAGKPGEAIDALMKREFAPGRERIPMIIARMQAVPRLMDAMKANIKNPPREFTELALRVAQGSVTYFRDTVPKWAAFGSVAERGRVEKAALLAQLAMEDAARWLERDLLPQSKGSYALGEERFLKKLRLEEMIDLPLAQLLATGEAALERDRARFTQVAATYAPGASFAAVMSRLADDYPAEAELLAEARASIERGRQFLVNKQLVTIPNQLRPTVTETPPFARNGAFASMDSPGAFETKATEAFYYVTPPERQWTAAHRREHLRLFNRPVLELISLHEAFPGHYLHFLNASRFPTKTRKVLSVGSTVEGWAHYGEQMMIEEGFGARDPRLELAQLSEALLRDCRFVAGIRLHTANWTVARAKALFVGQAGMEPANAEEEARRGTYNPTYLYYTMGKLMIYQLRDDYRKARGPKYSLRAFHDALTGQGGIPLPLIRKLMLGKPPEASH